MRWLVLVSLLMCVTSANRAEARLFWQTYGSVMPLADGTSTWNWNQDYFVPRHGSTGRYGLFSPCKTAHTTSPACRTCHPMFPGYCSNYGPCHYAWRNLVYGKACGTAPLRPYVGPYRHGCGHRKSMCRDVKPHAQLAYQGYSAACVDGQFGEPECPECVFLPNVETKGFLILGSIPADGSNLLSSLDLEGNLGLPQPGEVPPSDPLSRFHEFTPRRSGVPADDSKLPFSLQNLPDY